MRVRHRHSGDHDESLVSTTEHNQSEEARRRAARRCSVNDLADDPMCFRSESCVAGEEARFVAGVHQIHVRSTSPAIYRVPTPLMPSCCCVNDDISNRNLTIGRKRSGM